MGTGICDFEVISTSLWGNTRDLEVQGNYAYCAMSYGVMVLDISNPSSPVPVSKLFFKQTRLGGSGIDLAIRGNYAYYTFGGGGLKIIDISDPLNPVLVNPSETIPFFGGGIVIVGDFAYMACDTKMKIISLADPVSPVLVGEWNVGQTNTWGSNTVTIAGQYAYFCRADRTMYIIDISDPTDPVLAGTYASPAHSLNVQIQGNLAFIPADTVGMIILDISDPANLTEVCRYRPDEPYSDVWRVYIVGSFAYLNCSGEGLEVVDVTDPAHPTSAGQVASGLSINSVVVTDNLVFIVDGKDGLFLFDRTAFPDLTRIGEYETIHDLMRIEVARDYAYALDHENGVISLDVSDPSSPTVIGFLPIPSNSGEMKVSGDNLYLAIDSTLFIIDVSVPASPQIIGKYPYGGWVADMIVDGQYVYLAQFTYGLLIIDVSDPAIPTLVSTTPPGIISLAKAGNVIYTGRAYSAPGVQVIDVSDPTDPEVIGIIGNTGFQYLAISGHYLCADESPGGFHTFDIANPLTPIDLGSFPVRSLERNDAVSIGDLLFAPNSSTFDVYDLYLKNCPSVIASYYTPGSRNDVDYDGQYFYIADGSGLMILSASVTPNPVPGDADGSGDADLGDVIRLINYIFRPNYGYQPDRGGDANCDHVISLSDPIYLINYIFRNGPPPGCK